MFNNKFFAVDDNSGKGLSAEGILDILNSPDEDDNEEDISLEGDGKNKPVKKTTKEEEETEETSGKGDRTVKKSKDVDKDVDKDDDNKEDDEDEDDELDELAKELDEDKDEDELELITPVKRKEILAKYPNVFKDFPYLEKAYYREQKYSEIFPSIDDARAAQEDTKVLKDFESKILSGDLSSIVSELKKEDEGAYNRLIDNYLPSLQAIDERAFFHVVNSVIKPIIYKMVENGQSSQNDELITAARVLNQFMYGTAKWEPHKPIANGKTGPSDEEKKVQSERQQLFTERFESARTGLTEKVEKSFKRAIEKNIDQKEEMSDYVRRQATREAYETLSELLAKNTRFRAILDRAWKSAGEQNFSTDSMDKIQRIINAQAKTVLPSVIRRARNEALRGIGKRVRTSKLDKEDDDTDTNSGRSASSQNRRPLKESPSSKGGGGKESKIPAGMSNKDFIMSSD
jgi:hypothetical protein